MRFLKRFNSLFNLGLRGSSLVFRFLLSFYIIKYLGLEASGIYGLALGAVGIAPALLGWGLNYFVARDIVGLGLIEAVPRVKTRLLVTTLSLTAATLLGLVLALVTGYRIGHIEIFITILIWLEVYGMDIHIPLIAMEKSVEANVLVFIRLAAWVPFVMVAGIMFPQMRTLETVFVGWIASYVVALGYLLYVIRDLPLRETLSLPLEKAWVTERLKGSWYIYVADLGLVGLVYMDRYIVSFLLGLKLTGLYTFYWSLANSLQTLMATAVVQLALPMLFKAHNSGKIDQWRRSMRQQLIKTASFSTAIAVALFITCEAFMGYLNMPELAQHRDVFVLMLVAAIVRCCSDLFNVGLTSMRKDNHYATINLAGLFLTGAMAYVMISEFGFLGTGIATLATALIVATVRAGFLIVFIRRQTQGGPPAQGNS
ncbi:lipopolysaccharide biosynthesis protein [Xanthobacter versatilis]|uniref:Polysaccharide biosynthesis protein n=1 Tax=Xanthobacter autotrophicus (strain ATCC BAA-1158 / Py2) TaxID=78245 RepID=A7ILA0_XANP2|nr:polysaccharide biosynthesis protein [Xanthobacter autotrophicus Py2]